MAKDTTEREYHQWKLVAGDVVDIGGTELEVVKVSGGKVSLVIRPALPEIRRIEKPAIDGSVECGTI
jgi:hypothetical protein